MAEPTGTGLSPDGPLAGLIAGLVLLLGALAEYLRRKIALMRYGKTKAPSQLDRIEKTLAEIRGDLSVLIRTLVIETPEGGKMATSRKLADGILARLGEIEGKIARRPPPRPSDERIAELASNVESLSDAVQSGMDLVRKSIDLIRKEVAAALRNERR